MKKSSHYFFPFKILLTITGLSFLLFGNSCEREIDWEIQEYDLPTLVVEAILTNENKIQEIRLSRPVGGQNETPPPVSDAEVFVRSGRAIYQFVESNELAGLYQSTVPFAATIGRIYELQIIDGQKRYTAQTNMVPVLIPDRPTFEFVSSQNMYRIIWSNPKFHPLEQAMYEATVSWGHLPGFENHDSMTRARLKFFTLSTIDVSYNIAQQDAEQVFFPAGSIVSISKYSLTPGFASYLRALLAETQWQGSIFENARDNLSGNISNGGLGYFAASSVIRFTLTVN